MHRPFAVTGDMEPISTIIITYNEEANIRRCLESVRPFSEEIIVVDSGSTDKTVEIARQFTPHVLHQDWLGYGRQKQFALSHTSHNHVFSIDADEEVPEELQQEIIQLSWQHDGYYVPRRVFYLNRWLRHCWYPGYVLRLFRKDQAQFTDEILHESVVAPARTARLQSALRHYSYRNIAHHLEKMNDFTSLSARKMYDAGRRPYPHQILVTPWLDFLKMYVLQRGFLDGLPGLIVSGLNSVYVLQKYSKLYELSLRRSVPRPSEEAALEDDASRTGVSDA
jgi:glycosyltransferase involved in cell wall biosynthesis